MTEPMSGDVIVIGEGLIALASAIEAADRGARVILVAGARPGIASRAGAGLLAPSISASAGAVHQFALASRDRYPDFVDRLRARSGLPIELRFDGIIELVEPSPDLAPDPDARWLDPSDLRMLAPEIHAAGSARLLPRDGVVDTNALLEALLMAASGHEKIRRVEALASRIDARPTGVEVHLATGDRAHAARVVVAAGAWSSQLEGLPRPVPVSPLRGQMVAYASAVLARPVYASHVYLLPRANGRTLVGSTSESVGFDDRVTPELQQRLEREATALVPALAKHEVVRRYAGLRPMSPDGQPILGCDPEVESVIYATGHSRNGILLTPATAACVGALAVGDASPMALETFSISRFADA